ncbi:MAG: GNAT family N-acetyltransferase [Caldilineaceae bacterium]|nr:GNAT family N-acetyltransferase [Caldilineaceae bacterium]
MIEVVNVEEKYLEDAAVLVASRYRGLRDQNPLTPARYGEVEILYPLLKGLTENAPGVVALENGTLVGFLSAWMVPSWRGYASVISPEWGNAARLEDARPIYQALYTRMAAFWVAQKHCVHAINVLANDARGIEGWQWLGFGYFVIDAIRSLEPASGAAEGVDLRRATVADLAVVTDLDDQLWAHLASSPIFLVNDDAGDLVDELRAWLSDPSKALWLAYREDRPVAFLRMEGGNTGASTIVRDPGTVSITGAFTVENARGDGVATALLNRGLAWAREEGYIRCSVDFEAMNVPAARFWLRHFQPVCVSLYRHVNEQVTGDW